MSSYIFINQYASTPKEGFGGRYYYFAKSLQEAGCEVILVASANHHLLVNKPRFKGLWHNSNYNGLNVLWLKTLPYSNAHSAARVLNWFIFAFYLPFLVFLSIKPSQVHFSAPSPVGFFGAWILAKLTNSKSVFDVRDVWPLTLVEIGGFSPKHLIVRFLFFVEKFCLKQADIVTSNLFNMDIRMRELGISSSKFYWFSNGVDKSGFQNSLKNSLATLPAVCSGKKVVGYTGTLGEANSLYVMLDAAKLLIDRKEFVFVIVGDGKERSALSDYCKKNGIGNVIFMGSVEKTDIYKLQAEMDVLCVGAKECNLYRYGASPNKLYEYIYSGVPVLYYINTPGYHPIIDSDCGREVVPSDVDNFARSVVDLANLNVVEKEELSLRAKLYIENNHNYQNLAFKLVENVGNHDQVS